MMTDPIADMLTRIRNALMVKHERVDMPASRIKINIARILKDEGYIKNYKILNNDRQDILRMTLKYNDRSEPVIKHVKRESKPSRRVYCRCDDIPAVLSGLGVGILSTSKGVLTDREARRENVGGEFLLSIW